MAEKEGPSAAGIIVGDGGQVNVYGSSLAVNARSGGEPSTPRYSVPGAQPKKPGDTPDRKPLSGSISYFPKKEISKRVFHGEQTTATGEPRSIVIKRDIFDEHTLRETKMLLKLGPHQNVVGYYDSGTYNQRENMFLAMELCHPQNLRQYTEAKKKSGKHFDQELAKKHAKQIVAGLVHIHAAGITHRDLKPDNILFSLDQKNLKISDFGLSKEFENNSEVVSCFMGQFGTDGYRAPEILNKDRISQKVDIFSAGLVLYYVWSYGEHPYGSDQHERNFRIKSGEAPNFRSLKFGPKTGARNLLSWMLKFKPEDRPTIQQVEDDVILGGSSTAPDYISEIQEQSAQSSNQQPATFSQTPGSAPLITVNLNIEGDRTTGVSLSDHAKLASNGGITVARLLRRSLQSHGTSSQKDLPSSTVTGIHIVGNNQVTMHGQDIVATRRREQERQKRNIRVHRGELEHQKQELERQNRERGFAARLFHKLFREPMQDQDENPSDSPSTSVVDEDHRRQELERWQREFAEIFSKWIRDQDENTSDSPSTSAVDEGPAKRDDKD